MQPPTRKGGNTMQFSERYGIVRTEADQLFDPILTTDTPLFIDPFLVYAFESDAFAGSHAEVLGFFNHVFRLIAESGCNRASALYRKALSDLLFP